VAYQKSQSIHASRKRCPSSFRLNTHWMMSGLRIWTGTEKCDILKQCSVTELNVQPYQTHFLPVFWLVILYLLSSSSFEYSISNVIIVVINLL